jgi:hypothetical protein
MTISIEKGQTPLTRDDFGTLFARTTGHVFLLFLPFGGEE